MRESSLVYDVKNFKPICYSTGSAANVEFDFDKTWIYMREKKLSYQDVFFYHVHPGQMLNYSSMDLNCMKGFNIAFGGSSPFAIICFENDNLERLEYKQVTYLYRKDVKLVGTWNNYYLRQEEIRHLKELAFKEEV